MAKDKKRILLVGITYSGEALLLMPKPGGFDLPLLPRQKKEAKGFVSDLGELGFEGVSIVSVLERMDYELEGEQVILAPYVFAYEKMNQPFETFPLEEKREDVPPLVSLFLWKADVYGPLYRRMERTVPFLDPEEKKVQAEIECLKRHESIVGKKMVDEFCALCGSAASMRRVNEAFVAICNAHHINPNRPVESTDNKKKAKR